MGSVDTGRESSGGGNSGRAMVWMKSEKPGFGRDGKLGAAGAVMVDANMVANTLLLVLAAAPLLELQLVLLLQLSFKPVTAIETGGTETSETGPGFSATA